LSNQNLLEKEVLNLSEACLLLDLSASNLYKLTSKKQIPHFCPNGKKLYFDRIELIGWVKGNPVVSNLTNEEL
jgi:predicted DNA-binding transcriptional regulator AlpA